MKKRFMVLLTACFLLIGALSFAACGNPLVDTVKKAFKDEHYLVSTASDDAISKIAGAVAGFTATKDLPKGGNVTVRVYKFNKKDLAEEYRDGMSRHYAVLLKKEVYVFVASYNDSGVAETNNNSEEVSAAREIFSGCFK